MKDINEIIPVVIRELAVLTMFVVFLYVTLLLGIVLFKLTGLELTREHAKTLQLYVSVGFFTLYALCQLKRLIQWVMKGRILW